MRTIIVLGYDGYIGHALTLRLLKKGYNVVGIDNLSRRWAVKEMGSFSATPILDIMKRAKAFQSMGNFAYFTSDISKPHGYSIVKHLIEDRKPTTIVNLAQQPSAPYSQIDVEHAVSTAANNILSTINLLWILKDNPDVNLVQIGTMGEYDPAIERPIEEGYLTLPVEGGEKKVIFPRQGGSFYHTSKISATYFIEYACRVWNIKATDIMQGIVYGNWTPEIKKTELHTRLDSDEAFGTVVNRFIVQSVLKHPLTIYGKGEHKRGFLALNDSIQCLMLAIENPPYENYRVWNQLDTVHSMLDVAEQVKSAAKKHGLSPTVIYIPTPRVEKTDYFSYDPVVQKLKDLGFEPTRTIEQEAEYAIGELLKNKDVAKLSEVVMPKIKWNEKMEGK